MGKDAILGLGVIGLLLIALASIAGWKILDGRGAPPALIRPSMPIDPEAPPRRSDTVTRPPTIVQPESPENPPASPFHPHGTSDGSNAPMSPFEAERSGTAPVDSGRR